MARKNKKETEIRKLYVRSGNVCSFPGCTEALLNYNDEFIADICHIEAASPGGPRYNPVQTDEERRSYDNLMLMCKNHHKIIDGNVHLYTVDKLKEIKYKHESKNGVKTFKCNEAIIFEIMGKMETYWKQELPHNQAKHVAPEFAVPIDINANAKDLFSKVKSILSELDDIILQAIEPLDNFELKCLAIPNRFTEVYVLLEQLEILYYQEYIKTNSENLEVKNYFDSIRKIFLENARSVGLAD